MNHEDEDFEILIEESNDSEALLEQQSGIRQLQEFARGIMEHSGLIVDIELPQEF